MKNENGERSHLHGWETETVQDVSSSQIDIRSNTANQILQVTLWVETKRSERSLMRPGLEKQKTENSSMLQIREPWHYHGSKPSLKRQYWEKDGSKAPGQSSMPREGTGTATRATHSGEIPKGKKNLREQICNDVLQTLPNHDSLKGKCQEGLSLK